MDPAGPMHGSQATPGAARAGRRRAGAREPLTPGGDSRWGWLAPLGTSPIPLTAENVAVSMSVRWLGGMIVRGRFTDVQGMIHLPTSDDDTLAVTVEIGADSVRTGIRCAIISARAVVPRCGAPSDDHVPRRRRDAPADAHCGAGLAHDSRNHTDGGAEVLHRGNGYPPRPRRRRHAQSAGLQRRRPERAQATRSTLHGHRRRRTHLHSRGPLGNTSQCFAVSSRWSPRSPSALLPPIQLVSTMASRTP